jgi:predicted RecA/RadA family phage recombinase
MLRKLAIFGLIMLSLMFVTTLFAAAMQAPTLRMFSGTFAAIAVLAVLIGAGLRILNQRGAVGYGGDTLQRLWTMKLTHTATVIVGQIVVVGGRVVEACDDYLLNTEGVYIYQGKRIWPKEASLVVAAWAEVYWDATNNVVTTTAAGNTPIGFCCEAAVAADAYITFQLLPLAQGAITPSAMKTSAEVALADAAATLTATQMIDSGILKMTPSVGRILTTPTAAELLAGCKGAQVGTWFEFVIISLAAFTVTLAAGANVTLVGGMAPSNSSARFRARFTNVGTGTEAVTIYRVS